VGEALLRGVNSIGGDIDAETIQKAKKNISWLLATYDVKTNARLYVADATHIANDLGQVLVDAIVTEPFLGTTRMGEGKITDPSAVADIVRGLDKLYIGCLKHWLSVLKPKGFVVMAIPSFSVGKRVYSVKKVVDTCEILGYTKHLGPITYGRPHAIVQRNFFVFQKK
jgi:tRNA G10  N-methylase Trm11